jgi:hypothetical protein
MRKIKKIRKIRKIRYKTSKINGTNKNIKYKNIKKYI